MQILNNEIGVTTRTLTMEHKGEILEWSIGTYKNLKVGPNITADINRYWATLSAETQEDIFNIYKQLKYIFDTVENPRYLDEACVKLVKVLFDHHPFQAIKAYYQKTLMIRLPAELKIAYRETDVPNLTYLQDEYLDLVCLAIVLKIMVPIWGTYISSVVFEAGANFKEYRASRLLNNANIVESPPYKRLARYLTTYWEGETEKYSGAAIVAGLSSEMVPNWLLGNVLFRRVAIAELVQKTDEDRNSKEPIPADSIITTIFNYVEHVVNTVDKQFGGKITEKKMEQRGGDDDNSSVFENYKIKEDVAEGIRATFEVYLTDRYKQIFLRLAPDGDVETLLLVKQAIEAELGDHFQPTPLSKAIVMWVLDPVIPCRILDYVDYQSFLSAYIITYVLLHHWGYGKIALLLFAQIDREAGTMSIAHRQVTEEQLDTLNVLYPHAPNLTIKRKPSKRDSNVAVQAIRHVMEPVEYFWWTVPKWVVPSEYPQLICAPPRTFATPNDLEVVLADLIIKLKTQIHPGLKAFHEPKPE